ncbi:MAG: flippase [Candidatus Methanoperedens sp.]|nr:flippase [Candidatus Methanoperedens sp.]
MHMVSRIAKNTLILLIGEIGGKLLTLLFVIYTARYLHAEGYGILSFGLAFTGMFGIIAEIGFYDLIVREVSRNKQLASKYIGNVIILKTILIGVMLGLLYATVNIIGYPDQTIEVVYVLAISLVLDAYSVIFSATFQAYERMEYLSIGKILKTSFLLVGSLFIVYNGYGLLSFAYLYLVVSFCMILYNFTIAIKKFAKPKLKFDKNFCKWLLKEGFPIWVSGLFIVIMPQSDLVILSFLADDKAVGLYSAAYKIVFTLNFIPVIFISAIFPITSRLSISSKDALREVISRSFKYLLLAGLLLVVFLTLFGDIIITRIFGNEFLPSVLSLKILVWAELFAFLNMVYVNLLMSTNRQVLNTYRTILAALLNISLDIILIPHMGFIGTSYAAFAGRFFSFILLSSIVMKSEYRLPNKLIMDCFKIVVLTGVIWVFSYISGIGIYSFIIYISVFPVILLYLNVFDDLDRKIATDIYSSIKLKLHNIKIKNQG